MTKAKKKATKKPKPGGTLPASVYVYRDEDGDLIADADLDCFEDNDVIGTYDLAYVSVLQKKNVLEPLKK